MQIKFFMTVYFFAWLFLPFNSHATFIADREKLEVYSKRSNVIMIASTGRSGSTMLTNQCNKYVHGKRILKTHLLPPENFAGKIIFIFSNPNLAAESALYMTLHIEGFGRRHFNHVETADRNWLNRIGGAHKQTEKDNLLSYDALGTDEHLKAWLYTQTEPAGPEDAQILAIKLESLWNHLPVIRDFLDCQHFQLPPQRTRGKEKDRLYSKEVKFREIYNIGTKNNPRYPAYTEATILWEQAPDFQYLKLSGKVN